MSTLENTISVEWSERLSVIDAATNVYLCLSLSICLSTCVSVSVSLVDSFCASEPLALSISPSNLFFSFSPPIPLAATP